MKRKKKRLPRSLDPYEQESSNQKRKLRLPFLMQAIRYLNLHNFFVTDSLNDSFITILALKV